MGVPRNSDSDSDSTTTAGITSPMTVATQALDAETNAASNTPIRNTRWFTWSRMSVHVCIPDEGDDAKHRVAAQVERHPQQLRVAGCSAAREVNQQRQSQQQMAPVNDNVATEAGGATKQDNNSIRATSRSNATSNVTTQSNVSVWDRYPGAMGSVAAMANRATRLSNGDNDDARRGAASNVALTAGVATKRASDSNDDSKAPPSVQYYQAVQGSSLVFDIWNVRWVATDDQMAAEFTAKTPPECRLSQLSLNTNFLRRGRNDGTGRVYMADAASASAFESLLSRSNGSIFLCGRAVRFKRRSADKQYQASRAVSLSPVPDRPQKVQRTFGRAAIAMGQSFRDGVKGASIAEIQEKQAAAERARVTASKDLRGAASTSLSASVEERESPVQTLVAIPLDEATAKLTRMLKMEAKLKKAAPHHQLHLRDVNSMCHGLLPVAHQWCSNREIETRELGSTSAPEGAAYRFGGKTGQTERPPWQRIDEQIPEDSSARPREVASIIFETHECVEIMSQPRFRPFLDQAKSLDAALLQYHTEMEPVRVGAIALQFIEMVMAACHEGYTHEVMERFTWLPSSDIEAIVAAPECYSQNSVALLEGIRKIEPVLTWPPFMSYLHELVNSDTLTAEDRAWLRTKLKDLPTNEFSTWDWTRRLVGCSEKLVRFVNAVSEDVRANQMQRIVQEIRQVLPDDVVDAFLETGDLPDTASAKIKELVSTVDRDSDDYQSYKPATKQALADGGVKVLTEKVANARKSRNPKETLITLEWALVDAIKDIHPDAYAALFCEEGTRRRNHCDAGGTVASIVVETARGPHFLINCSHFVITAEQKTTMHRIKSAKSFMATMHLLNQAEVVSDEHLAKEKRLIGGFFSTLVGLDGCLSNPKGSFRAARNKISPKGAFISTVAAGAITTGNRIGKGLAPGETVYLRLLLAEPRFRAVLAVFGTHGPSPLESNATCPGVPAVGTLPALLCRSGGTPTDCAGASTKDWSLNCIFTCRNCGAAMRRREKENLRLIQENGHPLGPEQTERLNSSRDVGLGSGGNEDAKERTGRRSALVSQVDAYAIDPFVGIEDQVEALATDSGVHLDAMKQQLLNCATKRLLRKWFAELQDTSVTSLEILSQKEYNGKTTSGARVSVCCAGEYFWQKSGYFSFTKLSGADLDATKRQIATEVVAISLLLQKTLQHHKYEKGQSKWNEEKLGHIETVKEIVCHVVGRAKEE